MQDAPNIARIAALIGDSARAQLLAALMGGQALTATELAAVAGVTKQTASAHLGKLLDGALLRVHSQGRHRYFSLADPDVAQLLETLMGVAQRTGSLQRLPGPRDPALRKARICYDHLAGELGVAVFENLLQRGLLALSGVQLQLLPAGRAFFGEFGIDLETLSSQRRPLCRSCLDWSQRRHHLSGALGAALLARCLDLGWARRAKHGRAILFTVAGERALHSGLLS